MTIPNESHPLKVAIASEDGKVVHQHFGRAKRFVICEINNDAYRFLEVRDNRPACGTASDDDEGGHDEDRMAQTIALIADCHAVVVAQVGRGAVQRLAERGIQAFMIPDFIDSALRRLIASGALNKADESGRVTRRWL